MGSTAVADFDLQPSFTKKEQLDFKPDRSFSETRPRWPMVIRVLKTVLLATNKLRTLELLAFDE